MVAMPALCSVFQTFAPVVAFERVHALAVADVQTVADAAPRSSASRRRTWARPARIENSQIFAPVLRLSAYTMRSLPATYATPLANPLTPGAEIVGPAPTSLSMP